MGQNTLKINEGICQRVIRTCKKSTLIWKIFPIKKYRGEGFLAKNAVFANFAKFGEILQPLSGGCGSRLSICQAQANASKNIARGTTDPGY